MSLSHRELADVVAELAGLLPGQRLNKVNAPLPHLVQLVLGKQVLWLDLRPGLTGLYLVSDKLAGPATPPAWVMKVRSECAGMVLRGLALIEQDRVIRIEFGRRDQLQCTLVAELFGQRGRLLLLDATDRVLASLIGDADVSEPYRIPHPPAGRRTEPAASRFPAPDPARLTANRAVADHYRIQAERLFLTQRKLDLTRHLARLRLRLKRRIDKIESDLDRTLEADRLYHQAEVLKVYLGTVRRGQRRVSLPDPNDPDGAPIAIELDPGRTPVDNMQRMFSRARRLSAARGAIGGRLEESRAELNRLDQLKEDAERAGSMVALQAIEERIGHVPPVPTQTQRSRGDKRLPYRTYRSVAGKVILVGRSGPDNHELTFRIARGTDMWLHTRDVAGAHVLIRLLRDEVPDPETLLDAASLAAAHSPLRKADKVEVTYTRAKHVRPIKGAPPGLVSLSKPRTLLVRMEPERLKRLENTRE